MISLQTKSSTSARFNLKSGKKLYLNAFTLVELIVVIVILAILATIAFLSFGSQSASARDSSRLADIAGVRKAFEMYYVGAGIYPTPDNGVDVTYSGGVIWSQGTVGDNVYKVINRTMSKKVVDPLSNTEYDYSLVSNKREYQLQGDFENSVSFNNNGNNSNIAFSNITENNDGNLINLDTVNAAVSSGTYSYVSGNFNGVMVKVLTGSTYYVLPVPGLILSDATVPANRVYDNNFGNGKIVVPGTKGVLATFDTSNSSIYSSGALPTGDAEVLAMMTKIQNSYSGSNVATSNTAIQNIVSATPATLTDLGKGIVKSSLGGVVSTSSSTPIQTATGVCGTSNGQSFSSIPSTNLCSGGSASSVIYNTGAGQYSWDCSGIVSCNANSYIIATGGTITYAGGYKIHTFLTNGTFSISSMPTGAKLEYLVVAGGGGGGKMNRAGGGAGGGGAGGLLSGTGLAATVKSYTVTIGVGGAGATSDNTNGANGGSTVFDSITTVGGGGGGGGYGATGNSGGSGGGAGQGGLVATKGLGTTGQGNNGGYSNSNLSSGPGGGGAGNAGGIVDTSCVGSGGGYGLSSIISGTSKYYAGGGGGGGYGSTAGAGGNGGGGIGGSANPSAGGNGSVNTGGGGGGGTASGNGGSGGSGIVIVRYLYN